LNSSSKTLGRNDLCHCGSERKYKQCCLDKDEAAERELLSQKSQEALPASPEAESELLPRAHTFQHSTQPPWKGGRNTRGLAKVNIPRRSGGS